jgi:amidophosphoribosyltransferase
MMAQRLREAGARSVTLASTCPPIRHGCYYGIDFPDPEELVAAGRDVASIATALGVDGLHYISLEGLKAAFETEDLCAACLTGDYPTRDASFEQFLNDRRRQREETRT